MWLLGRVMFTENHGDTIGAHFIPIALEIATAEQPEDIRPRSWGSAVLAGTYRALCKGCQLTGKSAALLGCPLFLQLWSWERFSVGRPVLELDDSARVNEMSFDADRIDMPTFATIWTTRKVWHMFLFTTVHIFCNMRTNFYFASETLCT